MDQRRTQERVHVRVVQEDGAYWATVEEMPGVFATGDTFGELLDSLTEGAALWLAKPGKPTPTLTIGDLEKVGEVATAELIST